MNVFISEKVDIDKYNCFIEQHLQTTFYHLLEWHKVLEETYGLSPFYVIAEEGSKIVGCIPFMEVRGFLKGRRLVSLPLSHHVPILFESEDVLVRLLDFVRTLQNKYEYIEIRDNTLQNFNELQRVEDHISSKIELSDFTDSNHYWDQLKQRARRDIKRGLSNLSIVKVENGEGFEQLYQLICISKKRQGAVLYPMSFFRNLHTYVSDYTKLFIACYNSIPLASILIFKFKSTSIYAYAGNSFNDLSVRYSPMDFLLWNAIKEAFKENQRIFDLGSSPKNHSSLINFKNKWIPEHSNLEYNVLANNYKHISREGLLSKFMSESLRLMPLPIGKFIGPHLLKEAM